MGLESNELHIFEICFGILSKKSTISIPNNLKTESELSYLSKFV